MGNSKSLLWVLATAFILRMLWTLAVSYLNPDGIWAYDSFGYWYLGKNLLEYSIFSQSSLPPIEPDYFRTPLYPLFLSVFQFFNFPIISIVFVQQLMSVLTCYFTYLIGKEIFPLERTALIAAFALAADLPSIIFANYILTETLFGLLFVVYCFFFIRFISSGEKKYILFSSLICGLLILCRPIAVVIPLVHVIAVVLTKKQVLPLLAISVFIIATIISPWLIRNKITFGEFSLTYLPGHNLLNHHAANILAEKNNISFAEANVTLRLEMLDRFEGDALLQPAEYSHFIRNESFKIIFQNAELFIKQHFRNVVEFMIKPIRSHIDFQLGMKGASSLTWILVGLQFIFLLILYVSFVKGIFLLKHNKPVVVFFLLLIIFFANMTVPPFSEARLRIPVMPLIALVGAAGVAGFLRKKDVSKSAGLE